jgi:hypothetical protein
MCTVSQSIRKFLASKADSHNGPDLLSRWNVDIETQVLVDTTGAQEVEGKKGIWTDGVDEWWHIRMPKKADRNPTFNDHHLRWSLEKHALAVGATGWDWKNRRSLWVGFDFDALVGHKAGLSSAELDAVKEAAMSVPWVEVRNSTSGSGLHLYVLFDAEGIPTANHTEHARLAKAVLPVLSGAAGHDFDAAVDVCGHVLWIWHKKMTAENGGFALVKAAEATFSADSLPDDWRKPSEPKAASSAPKRVKTAASSAAYSRALEAMQRIASKDNADGSRRLFACACRGVEHDLSDADIVRAVREYEESHPFPREWSDSEILNRVRDAEGRVIRGSALDDKPELIVSDGDLAKLSQATWSLIRVVNDPPTLFRYGGLPIRIEHDDNGEPTPKAIQFDQMRHHLAQWIRFVTYDMSGTRKNCLPPSYLVKDLLATPNMSLPILDRITEVPVFAENGTIETLPGYSSVSRTLYLPQEGFTIPLIPLNPSADEVKAACEMICTELLGDFPFVSDAERAHAVALLLLPFVRSIINGPTPLHLFEKPAPGTGATLLVNALSYPATGHPIATMTEGRDEDEWRKRLTSKLRTSPAFLVIDNLRASLDSAAVASAITSPAWEDRLLGASQILRIPVRCAWVATGNNPKLSFEIARRTVRIRLNAKVDQPWVGRDFRHPDLMEWVARKRSELVTAALTLVQAWIANGRPSGTTSLGMFEGWSRTIGGILQVAGIGGFLANRNEFYAAADEEGAGVRALIEGWWAQHKDTPVATKDLLALAREPLASELGTGGEHSQLIRLGKKLHELKDRTYQIELPSNLTVPLSIQTAGKRAGGNLWSLALAA